MKTEQPPTTRLNAESHTPGMRALSVTLVMPAKNEALNIPHVFSGIPDVVDEVILVDGRSEDGTADVARELRPDIRIVTQTGRGKGDALRCGFAAATGDIIVMADADGSTDLTEIPRFLEALLEGADFVKGSRYLDGGGSADLTPIRRFGNSLLSGTVNVLFGTEYTDLCYGYNAFWARCLAEVMIDCDGFEVETLINLRLAACGLAVAEVPSFERERLYGKSNLNVVRDGMRVLRTIVRERLHLAKNRTPMVVSLEDVSIAGTEAELATELAG